MAFKLENFGAEVANAKSTLGGICYYRYFNEENNTLTTAGYFPATLGLEVGDRIRVIPSVKTDADEIYIVTSTANRTVTVKQIDTDGAVDSVNGKTGAVVLTMTDLGMTTTTATLAAASWADSTQTVSVTGVTATNTVFVAPAPASASDYATGGVLCTTQATDSLTFTCTATPTNDITVNVVIFG